MSPAAWKVCVLCERPIYNGETFQWVAGGTEHPAHPGCARAGEEDDSPSTTEVDSVGAPRGD